MLYWFHAYLHFGGIITNFSAITVSLMPVWPSSVLIFVTFTPVTMILTSLSVSISYWQKNQRHLICVGKKVRRWERDRKWDGELKVNWQTAVLICPGYCCVFWVRQEGKVSRADCVFWQLSARRNVTLLSHFLYSLKDSAASQTDTDRHIRI